MQPSKQRLSAWLGTFALSLVLVSPLSAAAGAPATAPVDLNNATEQQLENLPGVGKATAAKIIAGRPYTSVNDLAKAGVSKATITKIGPLVTFGPASSASKSAPAAATARASKTAKPAALPAASGAKVDINNATEKQLEDLPGVGKATAGKIISGRPYSSVDDLAKSGVSKSTISKISPLVMVGAAPAAPKPAAAAPVAAKSTPPPPAPTAAEPAAAPRAKTAASSTMSAPVGPPPVAGMVWVNLDTKVYHKQGDRWYGKTKNGKYMAESDAIKAGYRLAK
jgi:competence protein ComEA